MTAYFLDLIIDHFYFLLSKKYLIYVLVGRVPSQSQYGIPYCDAKSRRVSAPEHPRRVQYWSSLSCHLGPCPVSCRLNHTSLRHRTHCANGRSGFPLGLPWAMANLSKLLQLGLEPRTLGLLDPRSNRLSYKSSVMTSAVTHVGSVRTYVRAVLNLRTCGTTLQLRTNFMIDF